MNGKKKTREELRTESALLRQRVAALEEKLADRGALEEALKKSEERFRLIFDSLREGLLLADRATRRFLMCNPAIQRMLGYTAQELNLLGLDDIHPKEDLPWVIDQFEAIARNDLKMVQDVPVKRKNGQVFYAEISASFPMTYDGKECLVGVFRDISERKEAARTRQSLEAQLAHAQKMDGIGRLAGGMAHDFNNLLAVILGSINLAQTFLKSRQDVEKALARAESACLQATELARQLLALSKGAAPFMKIQSLRDLLHSTTRLALSGSDIALRLSVTDGLWLTHCDENQIHQVMMNLLINAKEATDSGGSIEVTAGNVQLSGKEIPPLRRGKYVKISVEDHGKGIPRKDLRKIFDPYFSTKSRGSQKGMGLGLSLAYSILKKHEGHIIAESELGVGSKFHVYLPASEMPIEKRAPNRQSKPAEKPRILVMDDEEVLRDVISQMIEALGYEVETARDGIEAIEKFRAAQESGRPFAVVLLDLTVRGGMGGRQAIPEILKLDPSAKAVLSSGYSDHIVLSRCREYGFAGALRKPYQLSELSEVLQIAMGHEQ